MSEQGAYKGRLFGKNVLEAQFRALYGEDLFVGEILAGEDHERGRSYLFRVVDVTYGTEASEVGWAERTAGQLIKGDQVGEELALHDVDRRMYKVARCVSLGYVTPGGEFMKPKSLPAQFTRVSAPTEAVFDFLRDRMGDLEVGRLRSGETDVDFPVGVKGETLASHVGVFATTGMGKSNLMKVLASAFLTADGRYSMLLFDPHGEYLDGGGAGRRGLGHHPWAERRLRVYGTSAKAQRFQATRLVLSLTELEFADLQTAWDWSEVQGEAIVAARREFGDDWIAQVATLEVDDLADLLSGRLATSTLSVLKRRCDAIVGRDCFSTDPGRSLTRRILDDLAGGNVCLVDTSGLESTEAVIVASAITRKVLTEHQRLYLGDSGRFESLPQVLVCLEEAQQVLGRVKSGDYNVFPRVAREGRKFKVGLCAITQQPKLVDDELLSQFNTFFILGLADERDRNTLRASSKQSIADLTTEIQTLMPGECLITNPEAPFALPAQVHLYEEHAKNVEGPPPLRGPVAQSAIEGFAG